MKAAARAVLLTVIYWPFALVLVGLALMPECMADAATCESTKRVTAVVMLGTDLALYAALLVLVLRKPRH